MNPVDSVQDIDTNDKKTCCAINNKINGSCTLSPASRSLISVHLCPRDGTSVICEIK